MAAERDPVSVTYNILDFETRMPTVAVGWIIHSKPSCNFHAASMRLLVQVRKLPNTNSLIFMRKIGCGGRI